MDNKDLRELQINKALKNLCMPLGRQAYLRLEASIKKEGCIEPLLVWGDTIIDGYNRYCICQKHRIPFATVSIDFANMDEAIIWTCVSQLKRTDLTDEARKFLIGRQFESEKIVFKATRPPQRNQYSSPGRPPNVNGEGSHKTAIRIGKENHVSYATVEKYGYFYKAVELIGSKVPGLATKILSGKYKISHVTLMEMARLSLEELRALDDRMSKSSSPYAQYGQALGMSGTPASVNSIKDMPEFDPDASITELSLTIPTWVGSIRRTMKNTDIKTTSAAARKKLIDALTSIEEAALEFIIIAQED